MAKAPPTSRLAALRQAAGYSTHALGKLAGVPQPMVWRFEHGTTPKGLVAAFKLAAALGVAVTDIWPELPQPAPQHRPVRPASGRSSSRRPAQKTPRRGKTRG